MSFLDKFLGDDSSQKDKAVAPYFAPLQRRDYAAAVPLLKDAMRREDAHAMGLMAALTALGLGVEKDPIDACNWFRQAANRGNAPSQAALGMCLARGLGTPANLAEAAFWLYKAGTAGNAQAIEVFSALAEKDPPQAALGMCPAAGLGTPANSLDAAALLYKAGVAGNVQAIEVLGALAYQDNSVVGPHFTEDELCRLVMKLKKLSGFKGETAPAGLFLH